MTLVKLSTPFWRRTHTLAITNGVSSYDSRIPTTTHPTKLVTSSTNAVGEGVIPCGEGGAVASPHILLVPYGVAHTNCRMRVLGWGQTNFGIGQRLWVPTFIQEYDVVFGAGVLQPRDMTYGIAGSDISPNTLNLMNEAYAVVEPTLKGTAVPFASQSDEHFTGRYDFGNDGAHAIIVKMPVYGFRYVEVQLKTAVAFSSPYQGEFTGTSSANCLWARG